MRVSILLCLALLAPALSLSADADGEKRLYVASRSYDMAIAPVDRQSGNADEAVLYHRRASGDGWEELGKGARVVLPDGAVRFTSPVDVDADGSYEYTSRPVVGGVVAEPPKPSDPPQAVVVVDTLAPKASILAPEENAEVTAGATVSLSWRVTDENLGDAPGVLTYSTDGGKSWLLIGRALAPEGETDWTAPADITGPAIVRLAAMDLAGNVGRDVRPVEAVAPAVAAAPETPPAAGVGTAAPEDGTGGEEEDPRLRDPNRSWLYYLMAVNMMRQNKPSDALHYYWLAVKEDPEFVNAWADIALAYIDLGAYGTARDVAAQARDLAPDRIDLLHLTGETYHAEGMAALGRAQSAEDRMEAKGLIDQAVSWYGRALAKAEREWRQAEQAASFYRLGEVCYYVNMDREGARAYWEKILSLHTPPPNADLVLWAPESERAKEKKRQEKFTHDRVSLETWQKWARGYLAQMAERERRGVLDLMPAQRVASFGGGGAESRTTLAYSGNAMNPGREDGRSIFSPSADFGGPANVAESRGVAPANPLHDPEQAALAEHMRQQPLTDGYSFYADGERAVVTPRAGSRARGGSNRSAFSPGVMPEPREPADPYAFPMGRRKAAPWNSALPYGDRPVGSR